MVREPESARSILVHQRRRAGIVALAALALLVSAAIAFPRVLDTSRHRYDGWVDTTGYVVDRLSSGSGDVTFRDGDGGTHRVRLPLARGAAVGSRLALRYPPGSPDQARERSGLDGALIVIPAVALAAAAVVIGRLRTRRVGRRLLRIDDEGRPGEPVIVSLGYQGSRPRAGVHRPAPREADPRQLAAEVPAFTFTRSFSRLGSVIGTFRAELRGGAAPGDPVVISAGRAGIVLGGRRSRVDVIAPRRITAGRSGELSLLEIRPDGVSHLTRPPPPRVTTRPAALLLEGGMTAVAAFGVLAPVLAVGAFTGSVAAGWVPVLVLGLWSMVVLNAVATRGTRGFVVGASVGSRRAARRAVGAAPPPPLPPPPPPRPPWGAGSSTLGPPPPPPGAEAREPVPLGSGAGFCQPQFDEARDVLGWAWPPAPDTVAFVVTTWVLAVGALAMARAW